MLTKTHIKTGVTTAERIVAVFPCIGGPYVGQEPEEGVLVDCTVVTINEKTKKNPYFKLWRVKDHGEETAFAWYPTLPTALRKARESQGWG